MNVGRPERFEIVKPTYIPVPLRPMKMPERAPVRVPEREKVPIK